MKNSDVFEIILLSKLQKGISKAFSSVGVDETNKSIRYTRKSNGKSVLSIKLNDGLDSDVNNYIHFGAEPVKFEGFQAVNIFVHADKVISRDASIMLNLVQDDVRSFFEKFEDYLTKNDLENKEYDVHIPVKTLKKEKTSVLTRIKKLFHK